MSEIHKHIAIIGILLLLSLRGNSQYQLVLSFYDACTDSLVTPHFEANGFSKSYLSNNGVLEVDKMGAYTLSVNIVRDSLVCFFDKVIIVDEQTKSDTIYLPKIALCSSGVLHSKNYFYLECGSKCDGKINEMDSNGYVRLSGRCKDGWPQGKLKFYNHLGQLVTTEVHRNRRLLRVK